jgi:anaerobic selenocysteine-containing dehydrogenase
MRWVNFFCNKNTKMKDNVTPIEMLFENVEEYTKTTIELLKLKAISKSADVISSLISKAVITISVALSIFITSIGAALWLGKCTGQNSYGFFIVAAIYLLVALLFYVFRNAWIKTPLKNNYIAKLLNKKV